MIQPGTPGELEVIEPHLPEDFKIILKQLEMVIEIYHELIMVWAKPAMVSRTEEDKK